MVLPEGAPAWTDNRAARRTEAEAAEKRKDACLARECEVALSTELPPEPGGSLRSTLPVPARRGTDAGPTTVVANSRCSDVRLQKVLVRSGSMPPTQNHERGHWRTFEMEKVSMAGLTKDSSAEPATRMAVPVWKLPQRSRRVEGRLWVGYGRSSLGQRSATSGLRLKQTEGLKARGHWTLLCHCRSR